MKNAQKQKTSSKSWQEILGRGAPLRAVKPRRKGVTMVIDRNLGPESVKDLVEVAGDYIDHMKIGFGTAVLFNEEVLARKIEILRQADIEVYPGGTLFELAFQAGHAADFFAKAKDVGFTAVEISDGSVLISDSERDAMIRMAAKCGFKVITEVGKKDPKHQPTPQQLIDRANADFALGAAYVIVEARESGTGIGVFDKNGAVLQESFAELVDKIESSDRLIWEAPLKSQQVFMIQQFGANANLGNIAAADVLSLEALRQQLRWDTIAA